MSSSQPSPSTDPHGHETQPGTGHQHGAQHQHGAHQHGDTGQPPAEYWEARYAGKRGQWSGNPNALLVGEVEAMAPGTALDLGCGEGGDAIWLARLGWQVTAVDIAESALSYGAEHAAEAGVGGAITWERHDLSESMPAGPFDLVSACYLQSPVELPRGEVLRAAADRVAPGGTLLIVGHSGWPAWMTPMEGVHLPKADEVLADLALPESAWRVERAADVDRVHEQPDGAPGTRPDSVLRLTRLR